MIKFSQPEKSLRLILGGIKLILGGDRIILGGDRLILGGRSPKNKTAETLIFQRVQRFRGSFDFPQLELIRIN